MTDKLYVMVFVAVVLGLSAMYIAESYRDSVALQNHCSQVIEGGEKVWKCK